MCYHNAFYNIKVKIICCVIEQCSTMLTDAKNEPFIVSIL